jgi:glycosyltransferase involved in cell wall biosynthesis
MQRARAFVQHSVTAPDGDSEGTPVAIIEAQMSGLPVVSTRHAGIPDVVIDGETGFLVNEGDVAGMGRMMARLASQPALAARLGESARRRALAGYTLSRHLEQLAGILSAVAVEA